MSTIAERLEAVHERIQTALALAGRRASEARLVAVSKTVSADAVREAYEAGQRDFGENYVQELNDKRAALGDLPGIRWHMIGHVQRNKARHVASGVVMIHSVHSAALAQELSKRRALVLESTETGATGATPPAPLPVLIEVNVGREAQKSGCLPEAAKEVAVAIDAEQALRLCGLMTVPPHTETPDGALLYFRALSTLRDALGGQGRLPELSMGMSFDLESAIAAGATIVRVGTLVFGPRA